jgi:hypothetical protein
MAIKRPFGLSGLSNPQTTALRGSPLVTYQQLSSTARPVVPQPMTRCWLRLCRSSPGFAMGCRHTQDRTCISAPGSRRLRLRYAYGCAASQGSLNGATRIISTLVRPVPDRRAAQCTRRRYDSILSVDMVSEVAKICACFGCGSGWGLRFVNNRVKVRPKLPCSGTGTDIPAACRPW